MEALALHDVRKLDAVLVHCLRVLIIEQLCELLVVGLKLLHESFELVHLAAKIGSLIQQALKFSILCMAFV